MRPDAMLCGTRYTAAQQREAVRLYRRGVRAGVLSRRYGCSPTTIADWMRKAGVDAQKPGQLPAPLPSISELYRMHRTKSWRAIADELGVSLSTVLRRKDGLVSP